MEQNIGLMKQSGQNMLHLGTLVCRRCGEIIDTLPTDGVSDLFPQIGKKHKAQLTRLSCGDIVKLIS